MTIDCDRCTVRGLACANCAVTFVTSDFLLEDPAGANNPADTAKPGHSAGAGGHSAGAGNGRAAGHGAELDAADLRPVHPRDA
ncbi:MAG: hypothetical protein ACRDN0_04730, partial [Trebonia sp.]